MARGTRRPSREPTGLGSMGRMTYASDLRRLASCGKVYDMTTAPAPIEVPLFAPNPETIGIVYADDGTEFDRAESWETGQCYANAGYRVVAVAPVLSRRDGSVYMTVEDLQRLFDYERALAADCFGPGVRDAA